jgi:hypothetical protein
MYTYPEIMGDPLPCGTHLGELCNEIPAGEEIVEFVSGIFRADLTIFNNNNKFYVVRNSMP